MEPDTARAKAGFDPGLDAVARRFLVSLARESIVSAMDGGGSPPTEGAAVPESCLAPYGAFVTLTTGGRLRGCIGRFGAIGTLADTVVEMARAAAFDDPRFPPVSSGELPSVRIEITVLSPMRQVESTDEITVGRHGLYLAMGGRSGVLLPQVPVEYGWDRDEFLSQTCRKAGIPPGSWTRPECRVFVFEGTVFGED